MTHGHGQWREGWAGWKGAKGEKWDCYQRVNNNKFGFV